MSAPLLSAAIDAVQITLEHSRDISGLEQAFTDGRLNPDEVIGVTGKTEGHAEVNGPRVDADHAIRQFLAEHGTRSDAAINEIPMVFTEGNAGILTPQAVVYSRRAAEPHPGGAPRLAMGAARSVMLQPEWTGTRRILEEDIATVRAAAADAGLDPHDIEFVVGKAYHVHQDELTAARAKGQDIPEFTDAELFRMTSGSAGLAVAVAVDGIDMPEAEDIGKRRDLWSGKVAVSANPWEEVGGAGPETQLMAFGNRIGVGGNLSAGHAVLADPLDIGALPRALRKAGLDVGDSPLTPEQRKRVVAVYVKVGPNPNGRLRGRRQLIEHAEYGGELKAAVSGMFAAYLQDTLLFLSGSSMHQGPVGGGTVAVVVDLS